MLCSKGVEESLKFVAPTKRRKRGNELWLSKFERYGYYLYKMVLLKFAKLKGIVISYTRWYYLSWQNVEHIRNKSTSKLGIYSCITLKLPIISKV